MDDDQPLNPNTSLARFITERLGPESPPPHTFPSLNVTVQSALLPSLSSFLASRTYLSLGPPPGPGRVATYSGPRRFASRACIVATLSSDQGVNLPGMGVGGAM